MLSHNGLKKLRCQPHKFRRAPCYIVEFRKRAEETSKRRTSRAN